jgi:hypothetical protein
MRYISILLLFASISLFGQVPLYKFVNLEYNSTIPNGINSSRSAVIVCVPDIMDEFRKVGDWKKVANLAHSAFVKMKVDPIFYVSQYDLTASATASQGYAEIFSKRSISNFIFITQDQFGFEIVIVPNKEGKLLFKDGQGAYKINGESLQSTLLALGKDIRRADQVLGNFLIPEKATFLSGISIIEKTQLKNYPGQLRRSVLAVERFGKLPEPKIASESVLEMVRHFNSQIDSNNIELDSIMKSYPYEYVMIDPMSDEDLLRNRHQFVVRSLTGSATSVREMLDFTIIPSERDYVSVIPIMPDRTSIKSIPKDAIVTKFYVKQNISKNVHVGEWDADETWQQGLINMIGNLTQRLNLKD